MNPLGLRRRSMSKLSPKQTTGAWFSLCPAGNEKKGSLSVANERDEPGHGNRRFAVLLALVLVLVLIGLVALWFVAGRPYDPFVLSRSDNVRAKALADAARAGPLSDVEFNESLTLMKSGEEIS